MHPDTLFKITVTLEQDAESIPEDRSFEKVYYVLAQLDYEALEKIKDLCDDVIVSTTIKKLDGKFVR